MWSDIWDEFGGLVIVFALIGGLIVGIIGLAAAGSNHSTHVNCLRLHEQTGLPTKVARSGIDTECYIKTESGHWIPSDRYRGIDD